MNPILSFLRRLWPSRRAAARPLNFPDPASNLVTAPPEPHIEEVPASAAELEIVFQPEAPKLDHAPAPYAEDVEDDESEDWVAPEDLEDESEALLAPDPFITSDGAKIEVLSPETIGQRRAEARALALTGSHKVFLSDSAGPGTLAEALDRLLQEGRMVAEFREDDSEGPHIHYTAKA